MAGLESKRPGADLDLPEQDFVYLAGSTDRPWGQFTGRWKAIQPLLTEMLKAVGTDRPLRVVDAGSCTGYFSLQAAHWHPEADVVGIEGSVGVGNGRVGAAGSVKQILRTDAVQTHLRWIQQLGQSNCFVAPEVWDYIRVCDLASGGKPICDVMMLLSVIHHIDGVSHKQYEDAGLSRTDGAIDLIAKLLLLSGRHFIELPNKPWLATCYDVYHTQRGILEAATKASGKTWRFKGPIYQSEWFGTRELWVVEAEKPMPDVDVQTCPFPLLYRGDEVELAEDDGPGGGGGGLDGMGNASAFENSSHNDMRDIGRGGLGGLPISTGGLSNSELFPTAAVSAGLPAHYSRAGLKVDPGLLTLSGGGGVGPVDGRVGEALSVCPTDLLVAHLALRDAIGEAHMLLESHNINTGQSAAHMQAKKNSTGGVVGRSQQLLSA